MHVYPLAVDYSSVRHLLELTEGETDLDSDKEIPDIFSKVSYSHAHSDHSKNIVFIHPIYIMLQFQRTMHLNFYPGRSTSTLL